MRGGPGSLEGRTSRPRRAGAAALRLLGAPTNCLRLVACDGDRGSGLAELHGQSTAPEPPLCRNLTCMMPAGNFHQAKEGERAFPCWLYLSTLAGIRSGQPHAHLRLLDSHSPPTLPHTDIRSLDTGLLSSFTKGGLHAPGAQAGTAAAGAAATAPATRMRQHRQAAACGLAVADKPAAQHPSQSRTASGQRCRWVVYEAGLPLQCRRLHHRCGSRCCWF